MQKCVKFAALALMATMMTLPAKAADKVIFSLNWVPYGLHYGVFAAEAQGYYRDANIDIDIQRGYGSGDTVKRVATGAATVGMADMASIIIGRGNGLAVKQIAVVLDRSADAIFYVKGIGIEKPEGLAGKSLGAAVGETPLNLFPVFAGNAGLDPSKVKVVNVTPPAKFPTLVSKKVDAIVAMLTEEPAIQSAAQKAGVGIGKFVYSDYGVDYYSIGLIAGDDMLKSKSDLVKRFVGATMRGYRWAIQNPEAAADAFSKRFPESSRDLTLAQWKVTMQHMLTDQAKANGVGFMDRGKMEKTLDLIKKYQQGKADIKVEDVYSPNYLEKIDLSAK
ncbi:MAG TPA: ABC transporter substrate-binding protein [Xanthobacteraceae bacterium]|nr:ABC transporter substrate-binding protein [Xanthobacteraceae bacterium]